MLANVVIFAGFLAYKRVKRNNTIIVYLYNNFAGLFAGLKFDVLNWRPGLGQH
jgi:hypothetical protein